MTQINHYTPTIEEFGIDFKYQYLKSNGAGYFWLDDTITFFSEITEGDIEKKIEQGEIRVKCLDKEDLVNEGWIMTEDKEKRRVLHYEKPFINDERSLHSKVFILYNLTSKWALITTGNRKHQFEYEADRSTVRFCGYIKNINELNKLINMLNIKSK